jgi:hypothetical protein
MANVKKEAPVVEEAEDLAPVLEGEPAPQAPDPNVALAERVDVLEAELQVIRDYLARIGFGHKLEDLA